jgi:hypothetical protein
MTKNSAQLKEEKGRSPIGQPVPSNGLFKRNKCKGQTMTMRSAGKSQHSTRLVLDKASKTNDEKHGPT